MFNMQVIKEEPTIDYSTDHLVSKFRTSFKSLPARNEYDMTIHIGSLKFPIYVTDSKQTIAWLADTAMVRAQALQNVCLIFFFFYFCFFFANMTAFISMQMQMQLSNTQFKL